eukprot:7262767-Prymnesium_polylepis.1
MCASLGRSCGSGASARVAPMVRAVRERASVCAAATAALVTFSHTLSAVGQNCGMPWGSAATVGSGRSLVTSPTDDDLFTSSSVGS